VYSSLVSPVPGFQIQTVNSKPETVYLSRKDMNEDFLHKKLEERKEQNAYRQLRLPDKKIDFCSNDYLGMVRNDLLNQKSPEGSIDRFRHGSTGSRLLSGNYELIDETEKTIAGFHDAEAGLIFNSGYDANLGLLSSVPGRGDTIIYDQLSHASIRDGVRLSFAQSFSFVHNSLKSLEEKLKNARGNIFVVTESVFSMDGDMAPLTMMASLCEKYQANLIVDEAHATGVIGERGEGLVQERGLQKKCFARVHTFGKALGCHGAIILGSEGLRNYLINFSRTFIFTTALPEVNIAAIKMSYKIFPDLVKERIFLKELIRLFNEEIIKLPLLQNGMETLKSSTPIQAVIVSGNERVRGLSKKLFDANLDIRPILYPTVPKGKERLRIVLHSYNTREELMHLMKSIVL